MVWHFYFYIGICLARGMKVAKLTELSWVESLKHHLQSETAFLFYIISPISLPNCVAVLGWDYGGLMANEYVSLSDYWHDAYTYAKKLIKSNDFTEWKNFRLHVTKNN